MFLLTIMQDLITLISGLIIALVIFALYTNSHTIRKKTREEVIQKLKLDSIIGVINETKEITTATSITEQKMVLLAEIMECYHSPFSEEEGQKIINVYSQAEKENKILVTKIENFIFLLNRDIIINGESPVIEKEIEKIKEIYKKIVEMCKIFSTDFRLKEKAPIDNEEHEMIEFVLDLFEAIDPSKEIKEPIARILKIYTAKLN